MNSELSHEKLSILERFGDSDTKMLVAEVARLNRALDFAELDVNQARADLDRALDALRAILQLGPYSEYRTEPWVTARAVLTTHDREPHDG